MGSCRRLSLAIVVVIAALAPGACAPEPPGAGPVSDGQPVAAATRESFLATGSGPEQVATAFVTALGDGRADRANALWITPLFTSATKPIAIANVRAGESQPASTLVDGDEGLSDFVQVEVAYVSDSADELLVQGSRTRRLTLGRNPSGAWWVVGMAGD